MWNIKDINSFINENLNILNICDYINDKIKIDDTKNMAVYKKFPKVIFDTSTFNFHIFPENEIACEEMSKEFKLLRKDIIKRIQSNNEIYLCKNKYEKDNHLKQILNKKSIYGSGSRGDIRALRSLEKDRVGNGLYKFVEMYYKGEYYTINFMRYTCDENRVGCTMRAIQFHKGKYVNKVENGIDICYPKTDKDNDYKKNSAGNICYNPPVEFPQGENICHQLDDIIGCFFDFVENADLIVSMKKEINKITELTF